MFTAISACGRVIVGFSGSLNERDGGYSGTANIQVSPYLRPALNAPYSGEMVTENSQTLADGTHIKRPGCRQEKTWRDSHWCVPTERPMFGPRRDSEGPANESDPALMVPAGYTVVDGAKSFTITWEEKSGGAGAAPPARVTAWRKS